MCALTSNASWLNHSLLQSQSAIEQSKLYKRVAFQCHHPGQCPSVHKGVTILWWMQSEARRKVLDQYTANAENKIMPIASISSKCHHPGHIDRRYAIEEIFSNCRLQFVARGCLASTRPMQTCRRLVNDHRAWAITCASQSPQRHAVPQ